MGHKVEDQTLRKFIFMMKWQVSGDLGSSSEIIISLEDFNRLVGKCAEGFKGLHGKMVLGKEMQMEEDYWSSVIKKSSAWQALGFTRQTKGKSLIVLVDAKQKYILCLWEKIQKVCKRCENDSMLQHWLMVKDLNKKVLQKIVRKQQIIRRKIWKLNENQTRVRFEKRVK